MTEPHSFRDLLNSATDRALAVADGLAERRVTALRAANPTMTPAELVTALEREFTVAVVATGAGTGTVAAVPAVGLPAALALSGGDLVAFLTAAASHALAVARIHGARVRDVEYQRALLLAVLLGQTGSRVVINVAGTTGVRWGQALAQTLPIQVIREVNRLLGGLLLKKFGPKAGLVTFVKVAPMGLGALIGGIGNLALAREVVRSTRDAFGPAPAAFAEPAATS